MRPFPPGFLFLEAGVAAWPEQRFVAGEPVAEAVAAAAAAGAADQALLGGPFQPARQGRAVRWVTFGGPLLQHLLLADLAGGVVQEVGTSGQVRASGVLVASVPNE